MTMTPQMVTADTTAASALQAVRRWPASRRALTSGTAVLIALAVVKFLAHMLTSANYGYFRDELYFIAASKHLDFGYVDFPPAVALIGALTRTIFGESQTAIHILPALAGALLVVVTGLIARELGGGRFAQGLAALAALVVPTYLGIDSLFSMNPFDELWWPVGAYLVVRILKSDEQQPRLWLLLGLVIGLGLQTKVTMVYFACSLIAGFILTPQRRHLRDVWPWLAVLTAGVLFLPYVAWQVMHGWPSLEFWRDYSGNTDPVSPLGYIVVQAATMNPLSVPLWIAGLYFYVVSEQGRPYRVLGWSFAVLFVGFMIIHAKYYFLAPAYPMVFAAGAVAVEHRLMPLHRRWVTAYVGALALGGLALAILTLPVLPPATLTWVTAPVRYASMLGINSEGQGSGQLNQAFADRFGWNTLAATVARVYHSLPRREQTVACILTRNYGEAGAIDLYGPAYHLPHAISGHDNYYLWGPGTCTGAVVIGVGWPRRSLTSVFSDVIQAATVTCAYCMQYEDNSPVYVCRHPRMPLAQAWSHFKLFYIEWTV